MGRYWKKLCGMGALAILLMMSAVVAVRAEQVLQVSTNGQNVVIFMTDPIQSDIVACKVSNQPAQILRTGTMSDSDVIIKTTILVDISTSIPANMRDSVLLALDTLIEQKLPNDEYRLVTFGQEETMLCDFTADRYDLGKAAQKIEFNGLESMIYDAVYHTIPSSNQPSSTPTLFRTIVVTDGVDLTNTGVTMEELFLRLQSERYPVDVLCVSAAPEERPNKELSAITRISGGRYCMLDPNTDMSSLGQNLGVGDWSYLEAQVPEHLLDGSVRQVDLTIGEDNLSFDVKFPAIYGPPEQETEMPTAEPEPSPTPEQAVESEVPKPKPEPIPESKPESKPEPKPEPEPSFLEQYGVICIAAAAVAAVILAVVIVLILKKKKGERPVPESGGTFKEGIDEDKTVHFIEGVQYTIKISAPKHPGTEWVLEVAGEVLIGRADYCDIRLEDKTVSREHCKIVTQKEGLEVVHLGSNYTLVNGVKVVNRCILNSGDVLSIGREQLRVDYIQKLDAQVGTDAGLMDSPSERTVGFFEAER